jgi:hypothetical protein
VPVVVTASVLNKGGFMNIRDFIEDDERIEGTFDTIMEEMSGAEIAKELGITRQAVSNTLKRAMKKMFMGMKKDNKDWNNFETAVAISIGLDLPEGDLKKFFKLFPPDIRKMIETDALESMPHLKGKV